MRAMTKMGLPTALIASATITVTASAAPRPSLHNYQCGIAHGATWREPPGLQVSKRRQIHRYRPSRLSLNLHARAQVGSTADAQNR